MRTRSTRPLPPQSTIFFYKKWKTQEEKAILTHRFFRHRAAASLADTEGDWSFGRQDEKKAPGAPDRPQPVLARLILRLRPLWVLLVIVDLVFLAIKNNGMTAQQLAFYGNKDKNDE